MKNRSRRLQRPIASPWPRLVLAAGLTVWAGANLWSAFFRWRDIVGAEPGSRVTGIILTLLVTLVPLVVAILLFGSVSRAMESKSLPEKKN